MGPRFQNLWLVLSLLLLAGCASIPDQSVSRIDPQLKCLAEVIYGEARGESRAGKLFVARVALTRVKKGFGPNICSVVYARAQFAPRRGYGPRSLAAARDAMKLGPNGITHFHSYKKKRTDAASFTKSPLCKYKMKVGGHWGYTCNESRMPAALTSGDVPSVKSRP